MGNASRLRQQRKQATAQAQHIVATSPLQPGLYTQVQVYRMVERAMRERDAKWITAVKQEYGVDATEKLIGRMNDEKLV